MGPTLRGERVVLTPADPSDADAVWAATEASLPELLPYMVWAVDAAPEHTRAFLEMGAKNWETGVTNWIFTIWVGDVAAGTISLLSAKPMMKVAEVGYWIRSDLAGRGHMTDAVRTIARWGFDEAGMERIELRAEPANAGSVRVAEKVGFAREGLLRGSGSGPRGERRDHYMYGLLKEEFER
jgi:RimJ/RimL family protein N-acetyltransferase